MRETITVMTEIDTAEGYLVVKSFNGSMVVVEEYIVGEDDMLFDNGERGLTLAEIGKIMKDRDGMNHKVVWEDR